jgi:hypothetical protein
MEKGARCRPEKRQPEAWGLSRKGERVPPVVAGGGRAWKTRLAIALRGGRRYADGPPRIEKGNSRQEAPASEG